MKRRSAVSLIKNLISMAIGPAGTGKTFLSIAVACRMILLSGATSSDQLNVTVLKLSLIPCYVSVLVKVC